MSKSIKISLLTSFLFAGLAIALLGVSAAFVIAATVSDTRTLDVTAEVKSTTLLSGGTASQNTVVISGFAFPNAKLTLLRDGFVATSLLANHAGAFKIVVNGLAFGNYQFSVYAEDPLGNTSAPYTINIAVLTSQPYEFSDVIVPPTISTTTSLVQVGQAYLVEGYTQPGALVALEIPGSNILGTTTADAAGHYQISARASLAPTTYLLRTKATFNNIISPYSKPVAVTVYVPSLPGTPLPPVQLGVCVDYNHDGHANLVDFSILLFWFEKPNPPTDMDCNGDRIINVADFSILMYYWTG